MKTSDISGILGIVTGLILIGGTILSVNNWIKDIEVRVDDLADTVEANRPAPLNYDRLAQIVVEEYGDALRGAKGAPGADAEPVSVEEVAALLAERYGEDLRGPAGQPGADADPVDLDALAGTLASAHADALRGPQGAPGSDSPPVSVTEVAATLARDYGESIRGPRGAQGPKGDPAEVYAIDDIASIIVDRYGETLLDEVATVAAAKVQIDAPSAELPDLSVLAGRWVGTAQCGEKRYSTALELSDPTSAELKVVYSDSLNGRGNEGSLFLMGLSEDGLPRLSWSVRDDRFIVFKNGQVLDVESTGKIVSPTVGQCTFSYLKSS